MLSPINVLMLSQYRDGGGAARAAWRIFKALKAVENQTGVFPHFHSIRGESQSDRVTAGFPKRNLLWRAWFWAQVFFYRIWSRFLFRPLEKGLHSAPRVNSGVDHLVGNGTWDVINLHWLGDATLSIEEIGKASGPVVWTLHDMWPYCGAEHMTLSSRFKEGYFKPNRPPGELGPDINRDVWERKLLSWRGQQAVVAPSEWAAINARNSVVFKNRQVREIPHPMDLGFWRPQAVGHFASSNKPDGKIRMGLVASADYESWAKGFDLVGGILGHLSRVIEVRIHNLELIVLGPARGHWEESDVVVHQRGYVSDDVAMRDFYHEVDVLLLPSLIDTFGLVAAEAHACGTPVVCFGDTGVASVVAHLETGYVASKGQVEDFATGIAWTLESPERRLRLSTQSRLRAESMWDERKVGRLYAEFFRELVENSQ